MNTVVKFYSKKPQPVVVNGEHISEESIAATLPEFADAHDPRDAAIRSLVVMALLRQQAAERQIEATSEEEAIEKLLEQVLPPVEISNEEVQRYYEGNRARFTNGDLFEARHILFEASVADKDAAREIERKAEAVLLQLKSAPESFEHLAREKSACTSGKVGGALGQLAPGSVVPEFWTALVAFGKPGLLPNLVESRHGYHIVQIDHCVRGKELPFEMVEARIRDYLTARMEQIAYQTYIASLVERAQISGIDLGDQKQKPPGPGLPLQ